MPCPNARHQRPPATPGTRPRAPDLTPLPCWRACTLPSPSPPLPSPPQRLIASVLSAAGARVTVAHKQIPLRPTCVDHLCPCLSRSLQHVVITHFSHGTTGWTLGAVELFGGKEAGRSIRCINLQPSQPTTDRDFVVSHLHERARSQSAPRPATCFVARCGQSQPFPLPTSTSASTRPHCSPR